jgi:hypothetical protein
MAQWNGKIFVVKNQDGEEWVIPSLSVLFEKLQVRAFQASGPYMPIGWPKAAQVGNASEWMANLQAEGFRFEPSSVE